jgi:hypothetical protein
MKTVGMSWQLITAIRDEGDGLTTLIDGLDFTLLCRCSLQIA